MSKFSSLATLKKQTPAQRPETKSAIQKKQAEKQPVIAEQQHREKPVERTHVPTVGKRNNPAYVQRTAYIQKTTDYAVKMKLLQQGGEKEFSELVEELLSVWLEE